MRHYRLLLSASMAALALTASDWSTASWAADTSTRKGRLTQPTAALKAKNRPKTTLKPPEIVEMLWALARGSHMGPGEGWFHGSQSRYSWQWLVDRFGAGHKGKITRADFRGPAECFDRLDRNHDGVLTADDFDWSDKPSPASAASRTVFQVLDTQGDGRITQQQWAEFFSKAAHGKGYVTPDDMQEAVQAVMGPPAGGKKEDGPSPLILVKGLMSGELGSFHEGPKVGGRAPDFKLQTEDGKRSYRLSQYQGVKPVVLIFGSFT